MIMMIGEVADCMGELPGRAAWGVEFVIYIYIYIDSSLVALISGYLVAGVLVAGFVASGPFGTDFDTVFSLFSGALGWAWAGFECS